VRVGGFGHSQIEDVFRKKEANEQLSKKRGRKGHTNKGKERGEDFEFPSGKQIETKDQQRIHLI
jgi:hypothetical protein